MLEDGDLLKIALSETNSHDDKAEAAASVLGPKAVGAMIDAYLEVRSRLRDGNGSFGRAASDRYSVLRQRLSHTQGASLVATVVAKSDAAKDVELAHLATFSRGEAQPMTVAGAHSMQTTWTRSASWRRLGRTGA